MVRDDPPIQEASDQWLGKGFILYSICIEYRIEYEYKQYRNT